MADTPTEDSNPPRSATLNDRRRPGRTDYQNPHLLPLLRGDLLIDATKADAEAEPKLPFGDMQDDDDSLGVSRGILNAAVIGAVIWAAIIFALRHFL